MPEKKRIFDKRIPLWLKPLRGIYRFFAKKLSKKVLLKQASFHGNEILIWANEDIGKKILLTKSFEEDEIHFLEQSVGKGDVCLDVGGNTGIYAMLFGRLAGECGAVHVFEPIRRNALAIRLAAEINDFKNIHVFEGVAGSTNGFANIIIPERDGAYAHIKKQEDTKDGIAVRSITVDSYLAKEEIKKVDILKIDVEGAEFEVLRGANHLLSQQEIAPRIVMVELFSQFLSDFDASIEEVVSYMAAFGYTASFVSGQGTLRPYQAEDRDKVFNVLFVRDSIQLASNERLDLTVA